MRFVVLLALLVAGAPALMAQPVPALPTPNMPEGASVSDYLRAAQGALVAGHKGEAEASLEMAQTRMLDRSVPLGQTRNPSDNPTVGQIAQARDALRSGDRDGCLRLIQTAMASASAQGL